MISCYASLVRLFLVASTDLVRYFYLCFIVAVKIMENRRSSICYFAIAQAGRVLEFNVLFLDNGRSRMFLSGVSAALLGLSY